MTPARRRPSPNPTPSERAAAAGRTVADVLAPGLTVVFCGINPGLWSAAVGHHFARPGNRFWRALHGAGLTDELLEPADEQRLLAYGIGITNLVARSTATAAELSPAELRAGVAALAGRLTPLQPRAVAFLGVGAYRGAFGEPRAALGEQPRPFAGARCFLLANPSGAQARYQLPELVAQLVELRDAVSAPGPVET